ncbi:hypothetical protein CVT25_010670 [Psilocybe cyanescens]|uniref:Uncharacterized protein n=1 Tax=Psilocybe cyanescens TaxID=93625 RepID=A0A409XSX9_PSICY|nr:hypothetical protein CVT25_010670 [Psilocybe cyanescens]
MVTSLDLLSLPAAGEYAHIDGAGRIYRGEIHRRRQDMYSRSQHALGDQLADAALTSSNAFERPGFGDVK